MKLLIIVRFILVKRYVRKGIPSELRTSVR